jgi:UPF0755 protein
MLRIGLLLILIVIIVPLGGLWLSWELNRPAGSGPKVEVTIERGETARGIAEQLEEAGLINSAELFVGYVTLKRISSQLEAGRYQIPPTLSMRQVVEVLRHGTFDVTLTFFEGWRREQYLEYALENLLVDEDRFSKSFLKETKGLEGYLFPNTYVVSQNISAKELVALMKDNFENKFAALSKKLSAQGFTKKGAATLASLIERETRNPEEMPVIAGIFIKRLSAGWYLDVDASIQYALGYQEKEETWWKRALTKEDLQLDSPYNTYRSLGLPPGPICSPGLNSLRAVAESRSTPYWFYLHDKKGKIHYARTLEEHSQNIAKYLR